MYKINTVNALKKPFLFYLFCTIILLFIPSCVTAHEQWFLTSHQMMDLITQPRPILFSTINQTNIAMLLIVLLCTYVLVTLGHRASRELFPDHQARLSSYGYLVPLFLRISTAIMLFMAIFGLNPRIGTDLFSASTLIFPDLQLNLLPAHWGWLKWVELFLAVGLMLGIYVRAMACLLLGVGILGLFLFKIGMLCYLGFLIGIALYLICQGPGAWYIPLPIPPGMKTIQNTLQNISRARAQYLLRIFTGLDFAFTGFICKFIYPNLAIALLTKQHMPTFGLQMETVVLWMAFIETFAGLLLLSGVLTRFIALTLLFCFVFMGFAIDEPLHAHAIFYGVLIACYINGAGQWRRSRKDKPAHIVILGASLSGIHCAMKLESLLGKNSNIKVTMIHHENYFQFGPLLSDVISGLVQPINIINPIRHICPIQRVIQGHVKKIHPSTQSIEVELLSEQELTLSYDQLIIAHEALQHIPIPGLNAFTIPITSISDALFVRKHIIDCLEKAELIPFKPDRKSLLTFCIIGSGLRAFSVATEIQALVKTALVSYPTLSFDEVKIMLFDQNPETSSTFDRTLSNRIRQNLIKMGIYVHTGVNIEKITHNNIVLSSQEKVFCHTIINGISHFVNLMPVDEHLRVKENKNIFCASMSSYIAANIPFQARYEAKLGQFVAYNAYANLRNRRLKQWTQKNYYFYVACLGRYASTATFGKYILTGWPAWILSRYVCVRTMPGLEKNLRVLMDWMFNIPFRRSTCTFSSTLSQPSPYKPLEIKHPETVE